MIDDIILNKIQIIERCLLRIREEFEGNPENLRNYTKQDSIILNLQRASEASIDLAMHLVAKMRLGLPQTSREAFDLLSTAQVISEGLAKRLKGMVGFRNIAVHDYQRLDLTIIQKIIEFHLNDFVAFTEQVLRYNKI
ncbi:type VII toxin-antitoxin system HepT family RNase toxin [Thermicanus aegyptius]|uniref:type VII toxin-antitoxin system HepT family RNase toxin n=1 Tax=Thermicanus aegyptius TaxID=94009 RepID=UPI000404D5F6|nr:DUF86 domain-containing protein [Thermicanus aegyptius]